MIFTIRADTPHPGSKHVSVRIFAGPSRDLQAYCGSLSMLPEEFDFLSLMLGMAAGSLKLAQTKAEKFAVIASFFGVNEEKAASLLDSEIIFEDNRNRSDEHV